MEPKHPRGRMALLTFLVALAGILVAATPGTASPGSLDRSFGTDGTVLRKALSGADEITTDGRGRTIVLSDQASGSPLTRLVVTRFLPDGRIDREFGDGGSVTVDAEGRQDYAEGLALTGRGRIVIAADTGSSNRYDPCDGGELYSAEVFRLLPRGGIDRSFGDRGSRSIRFTGGPDPIESSSPTSLAIAADGSIVLSGYALVDRLGGCEPAGVVARLTPGGDLDADFGGDGIAFLGRAYRASDVEMLAGGEALLPVDLPDGIGVARVTEGGELDDSFGDGGIAATDGTYVRDLAVLADGRAVLSGGFTENRVGVVAFDDAGSIDPGFGEEGVAELPFIYAYNLPLVASGDGLLAGGPLGRPRPRRTHDFGLARLGADGALDPGFARDGLARTDVRGDRGDDPISLTLSARSTATLGGAVASRAGDAMALARYRLR